MQTRQIKSISDKEWLRLIRLRDDQASGYFVFVLKNLLYNYLRRRAPHAVELSRELAIMTITILIEKQEDPVLTSKLTTYGMTIALNQWKRMLKKKGEEPMPEGLLDQLRAEDNIYDEIESSDRLRLVNTCMLQLNEKCRKLLRLFSLDIDAEEASNEMGYTSRKVYQVKKSECLQRLKKIVEEQPEFHELLVTDAKNGSL